MDKVDAFLYRTLGKNWVLRVGTLAMIGAGAVHEMYASPDEPMPLRLSKLALYIGSALGISSSIAPASVKPDLPPPPPEESPP